MPFTVTCDDTGTAREARYVFVLTADTTVFTPAANSLLVAFTTNHNANQPTSLSGHGTWTNVAGGTFSGASAFEPFFVTSICKVGASPSASAVTINWALSARGVTLIAEISGHDDTETVGNLIVQAQNNIAQLTNTTIGLAAPLSAIGTGNLQLAVGISAASEVTFSAVAPFTEVLETSGSGSFEVAVNSSETADTTPELDVVANNEFAGLIALEILAAGAGPSVHQSIDPRKRARIVL